jgi:hypothetical protein
MSMDLTVTWAHILSAIGLLITVIIAVAGFRTFGRFKKERIEEKRIDLAIEALAFAHKSKFIFDYIRAPLTLPAEWEDMPSGMGSHSRREESGQYYAILKRISKTREFIDQAWDIQVRCTAIFGVDTEKTFLLLHEARRQIEVSAEMLMREPEPTIKSTDNVDTWNRMRADLHSAYGRLTKDGDQVGKKLVDFVNGVEKLCRPVVDRKARGIATDGARKPPV